MISLKNVYCSVLFFSADNNSVVTELCQMSVSSPLYHQVALVGVHDS